MTCPQHGNLPCVMTALRISATVRQIFSDGPAISGGESGYPSAMAPFPSALPRALVKVLLTARSSITQCSTLSALYSLSRESQAESIRFLSFLAYLPIRIRLLVPFSVRSDEKTAWFQAAPPLWRKRSSAAWRRKRSAAGTSVRLEAKHRTNGSGAKTTPTSLVMPASSPVLEATAISLGR